MKRIYGIFAAVLCLAAGCAKEINPSDNGLITELTAGVAPTKTVLDGSKVYWTSGDQISVNGIASNVLAIDEPSATATFTFNGILNTPYKAVFPASIYKDENTVTMPSVQEYCETSFHSQASPMLAYRADNGNLVFSHPFAVVCLSINLKDDADKISYVEFRGNDNEQVCGDFTVDFNALTLTGAGSGDKVVRVNVDHDLTAGTPMLVHIVVPARTYANGFTVKVADENGHYMQKSVQTERVYEAGKVYDMKAFDFVPTDTELDADVTIASAAELIAFANAWNAGEYTSTAEDPFVVNLTQDIEFTAEDNAAWISIGLTNAPFTGVFNGNGFTISGFTSTSPLFHEVSNSPVGTVRNLMLDGAISRDLSDITGTTNVGSMVGILRGHIENCHSSVDITISAATISKNVRVGGLVAYTTFGYISNSSYSGNLVVESGFETSAEFYLGGITGYTNTDTAYIENSDMSGTVNVQGKYTSTSTYIGGLAGYLKYNIQGCTVNNNPILEDQSAHKATILINADMNAARVGGLVGQIGGNTQIDTCVNKADVVIANSSAGSIVVGGIVGRIASTQTVTGCANEGKISTYAALTSQNLGGLVGQNKGTVQKSENRGAILADKVITGTQSLNLAGCVGLNEGTLSGLTNSAAVTANTEGWKNEDGIAIAGVVAKSINGFSGLTNTADVVVNDSSANGGVHLYLGGILGWTYAAETAEIAISSCDNLGTVNFNMSGVLRKFGNIYVGGVLGYNPQQVSLQLTECTNSGKVTCGKLNTRPQNGDPECGCKYLGGIVGYLYGNTVVSGCVNSGIVLNDDDNNSTGNSTAPMTGGIVGRARGSSSTARVTLTNNSSIAKEGIYLQTRRGWIGGIVGHTQYVDITNCDCTTATIGGYGYYYGGIAGQLENSTITSCNAVTDMSATNNKAMGGIVGRSLSTSAITGCTYSGSMNNISGTNVKGVAGGLVGILDTGTLTVSTSSFQGDIRGTAMTIDNLCGKVTEGATLSNSSNSLMQ